MPLQGLTQRRPFSAEEFDCEKEEKRGEDEGVLEIRKWV